MKKKSRLAFILSSITLIIGSCIALPAYAALTMNLTPPDAPAAAADAATTTTHAAADKAADAASTTTTSSTTAPAAGAVSDASATPDAQKSALLPTSEQVKAIDASTEATQAQANANTNAPESMGKAQDSTENTPERSSLIKEPESKIYRDAFGNRISRPVLSTLEQDEKNATLDQGTSSAKEQSANESAHEADASGEKLNVAVVFFSHPENLHHESYDVDELSGASIIYDEEQKRRGIVEYLARIIQEQTGADLFNLDSLKPYPRDHEELIYVASEEFDTNARPRILIRPNFKAEDYDVLFIGYPIWWYDLPMTLYSFFEEYDLSGKIIVPFCTHGGSRPFKTFALIAKIEPNAKVLYNYGLVLNRNEIPYHGRELVQKWLHGLKLGFFTNLQKQLGPHSLLKLQAPSGQSNERGESSSSGSSATRSEALAP